MKPRVWVDTDVALGAAAGDVDDGFALAALAGAAASGRIDLLGVSTVSGNCEADEAERCAKNLLATAGVDVRVVRGGATAARAGAAGEELAALPDGTTVVAIGPFSNLAGACRRDPTLPARLRVFAVGGNLTSRGFLPPLWPHEFNFAHDRPSARAVFEAAWRELVVFPLDVLRRFRCDVSRLEGVASFGGIGETLAEGSVRWMRKTRWRHGPRGFPVWDLVPALVAAGVLPIRVEERTFPASQRRFAGMPERLRAAVDFDPDHAWLAFEALLGELRALVTGDW